MKPLVAILSFALTAAEGEFQLFPAGPFRARDGRPADLPHWLMDAVSVIVPRLDFFAKSNWLIYGAKSYEDLYLFLIQSTVFIPQIQRKIKKDFFGDQNMLEPMD